MNQFSPNASQMFTASMGWLDARWDEAGGIRLDPGLSYRGNSEAAALHYVRETAYYSLGLFLRGDTGRAICALEQVLLSQLLGRDAEYTGSFLRHPEETSPARKTAVEWAEYNPNWREYIGATLAMILCEFSQQLPEELLKRTHAALRRAAAGSLWRRVPAEYTHIALLKAFLLAFAGSRYDLEAWLEGGEIQGREIFRLFKEHQCFPSYNSPTDYGMALFGLAMWRKYSPSNVMQTMAAEMEEALWKDIAQFYHAGMGNLVGPYDRAYGMDMHSYASPLGLCIWGSVGRDRAPFPDLSHAFPQQHQLSFAIPLLIAGVSAPAAVLPDLTAFQRERSFERVISGTEPAGPARTPARLARTTSSWVAEEIMLGAISRESADGQSEPDWRSSEPDRRSGPRSKQFRPPSSNFTSYPATVHWRTGDQIGWICAHFPPGISAHAAENILTIGNRESSGPEDLVIKFLINSPCPPIFTLDKWSFPSLTVGISSNLTFSAPAGRGELFEIECRIPSRSPSRTGVGPSGIGGGFVTLNLNLTGGTDT